MKLLFRTAHLIEAQSLHDLLTADGIESSVMEANRFVRAEGTIHPGPMPEVWVADHLFERALEVKADWKGAIKP